MLKQELRPGTQKMACWKVIHKTLLLAMMHYSGWIRSKEPVLFSTDSSSEAATTRAARATRKLNNSCTIEQLLERDLNPDMSYSSIVILEGVFMYI